MNWLRENFDYSTNEIALIEYGFLSIVMELSKFIIMVILFTTIGKPLEFLFGTFILLLSRSNTGGLHFSSYISCLTFTILILYAGCVFLPKTINIPDIGMLILLLSCIIVTYLIGPIVSKSRPNPSSTQIQKSKLQSFKIIFIYFILTFLFSEYEFIQIGFWIILLQTIQLIFAYFLRKEKSDARKNI